MPESYDAIVLGAGLAGAFAARALAQRKLRVLVVEQERSAASKASGNFIAILSPYLAVRESSLTTVYRDAFSFSRQVLLDVAADSNSLVQCGAVQLGSTARLARDIESGLPFQTDCSVARIDPQEGSERAGINIHHKGLWIPEALYVRPVDLIKNVLNQNATVLLHERAVSLRKEGAKWIVQTATLYAEAPIVVVCTAHEAAHFEQLQHLPLEAVRGQTVMIKESANSHALRSLVCFDGYLVPSINGTHMMGAHYRHKDESALATTSDSHEIIGRCNGWLNTQFIEAIDARVCFRTSTFDRLPYVGSVSHGNNELSGLYTSLGHGSRGLQSCPWGGEVVARLVVGEALDELTPSASLCRPTRPVPSARLGSRT